MNVIKNIVIILSFVCTMSSLGAMEVTREVKRVVSKKKSISEEKVSQAEMNRVKAWFTKSSVKEIEGLIKKNPLLVKYFFRYASHPQHCYDGIVKHLLEEFNGYVSSKFINLRIKTLKKYIEEKLVQTGGASKRKIDKWAIVSRVLDLLEKESKRRYLKEIEDRENTELVQGALREFEDREALKEAQEQETESLVAGALKDFDLV